MKTQDKLAFDAKQFLKNNSSILYMIVLAVLAALFVPRFATVSNAVLIIKQSAIPVISCVAMAFILVTGNVDLSTGYLVGLVSSVCGILIKPMGLHPFWVIVICLLLGMLVGVCNGVLVAVMNIPSFIATLGSGFVLFGLAQIVGGSNSINQLPEAFLKIGSRLVGGLPVMVYYAVLIIAAGTFLMHRTTFGRGLICIGLNSKACFLGGVRGRRSVLLTYLLSGTLTALCSILMTIRVNCAQPDMGGGNFAFEAITAAVLGGTSLTGGKVNIICCAVGVIIVKIIENCINLCNLNYFMYQAILGFVIMLALIAESYKARLER